MMNMTTRGWDLRRPTVDDASEVLALMRAYDTAVSGEPDTDLQDLRHDWSALDLDQDAWLIGLEQGELLAYTAVLPHQSDGLRIDLYMAPDYIESELTAELLEHCLARANEIAGQKEPAAIKRLVAYILHSNHFYRDLFEHAGFNPTRHIFQMRKEMPAAPGDPAWPEGIHVRPFEPGRDDRATYELIQAAFDRPGRAPYSFTDWKKHMLRPGSFSPELWRLAFAGEELVGVCLGFDYPGEGWVRQLGVSEDWRGRGLGSALLKNAFSIFYNAGKSRVGLTVESDNPDALSFYKRIGMTVRRQFDEYVKPLPSSPGSKGL